MAKHSASDGGSDSSAEKRSPSPHKKLKMTIRLPSSISAEKNGYSNFFMSNTASDAASNCIENDTSNNNDPVANNTIRLQLRPKNVFIHDLFDIQKQIGEGGFGKVFLAVRICDGAKVALKSIPLNHGSSSEDSIQREVAAMQELSDPGHSHVCRLYHPPLRDNSYTYLAMEYIGGGELFEHLCNRGPFSEHDAAKFLLQFADGLRYIHSKRYVHSDLKPENLMMGSWQKEEACLKIVDFGFSVPDHESIKLPFHGTIAYLPPECLQKGYNGLGGPRHPTAAGDMFAAGVIVYTVLTGTHPFDRTNQAPDSVIARAIVGSLTSFRAQKIAPVDKSDGPNQQHVEHLERHVFDDRTEGLSSSSVSLMKRLLHPDSKQRMTASEFCNHPWILGQTAATHCLSHPHHSRLKEFWRRRFRAAILEKFWGQAVTNHHHQGVVDGADPGCQSRSARPSFQRHSLSLKDSELVFRSMDLNGDGTVSLDELKRCMMGNTSSSIFGGGDHSSSRIKQYMIDDIFSSIDEDGSGGIDLGEFQRVMGNRLDGDHRVRKNGFNDRENSCNTSSSNDNDEQILENSNEQVRGCIFQKFSKKAASREKINEGTAPTREMLRTIFDSMDINKDGMLQLSEAITVLKETPGLDDDMIYIWADKADIDLNGEIDFEEFCTAMMSNNTCNLND